jgi:hypothetical protein
LFFKAPQLRNLSEKLGLDYNRPSSRTGFGFTHDGRADTLSRLLFTFQDPIHLFPTDNGDPDENPPDVDRNIADVMAFLFCFSGTDPAIDPALTPRAGESRDVATATGRQLAITSSNAPPLLFTFLALADSPSNRIDLVARGAKEGVPRGWYFAGCFLSDRQGEDLSLRALLSLASADNPLILTLAPRGCGRRMGIDRDNDGWPDRTEIEAGFNPANPNSHGPNTPPELSLSTNFFAAHAGATLKFAASAVDPDTPPQGLAFSILPALPTGAVLDPVTGEFRWSLPISMAAPQYLRLYVRVTDDAWPFLSDTEALTLQAVPPLRILSSIVQGGGELYIMRWNSIPGQTYRVEYRTNFTDANWIDWQPNGTVASENETVAWQNFPFSQAPIKYFRVKLEP